MKRRQFLVGSAVTTSVTVTAGVSRAQIGGMNFSDPADNLDALVRIYSANDGTTCYWYARGRIYAVVPGQVAEPLFDGAAVQWIRHRPQPDGTFLQESQFVQLHYRDGAVIDAMTNPVTGRPITIPIMQSGSAMNQMEFSVYGVRRTGGGNAPERVSEQPKVYEWKIDGDVVVLTYEAMSTYEAPWMPVRATENSVRFYQASLAQLNDPQRISVDATRFEVSETPFMPWLEMPPSQPGHMLWRFTASKHNSRGEIPADLMADVAKHTPDFYERFMQEG